MSWYDVFTIHEFWFYFFKTFQLFSLARTNLSEENKLEIVVAIDVMLRKMKTVFVFTLQRNLGSFGLNGQIGPIVFQLIEGAIGASIEYALLRTLNCVKVLMNGVYSQDHRNAHHLGIARVNH